MEPFMDLPKIRRRRWLTLIIILAGLLALGVGETFSDEWSHERDKLESKKVKDDQLELELLHVRTASGRDEKFQTAQPVTGQPEYAMDYVRDSFREIKPLDVPATSDNSRISYETTTTPFIDFMLDVDKRQNYKNTDKYYSKEKDSDEEENGDESEQDDGEETEDEYEDEGDNGEEYEREKKEEKMESGSKTVKRNKKNEENRTKALQKAKVYEIMEKVNSTADEDLLELMVKIAEDPQRWRRVHESLQKLDQDLITSRAVVERVATSEKLNEAKKMLQKKYGTSKPTLDNVEDIFDSINLTAVYENIDKSPEVQKYYTELSKPKIDIPLYPKYQNASVYSTKSTAHTNVFHFRPTVNDENLDVRFKIEPPDLTVLTPTMAKTKTNHQNISLQRHTSDKPQQERHSFTESNIFQPKTDQVKLKTSSGFPFSAQTERIQEGRTNTRRTEESQLEGNRQDSKLHESVVIDNWSEMINNRNMKMNEQFDKWQESLDLLSKNDTSKLAKVIEELSDPGKEVKRDFLPFVEALKHGASEDKPRFWPGLGTDMEWPDTSLRYSDDNNKSTVKLSSLETDHNSVSENTDQPTSSSEDDVSKASNSDWDWKNNGKPSYWAKEKDNAKVSSNKIDKPKYLKNASEENPNIDWSVIHKAKNRFLSHLLFKPNTSNSLKELKNEWPKSSENLKTKITNSDDHHSNHSKWLHFSYHRVTTSPQILPRHRNAYVAVSVVTPTERNKTAKNWTNSDVKPSLPTPLQGKFDDVLEEQLIDLAARSRPWSHTRHLDKMKEQLKSLSALEEKLRYHWLEKQRLHEMLRDGGSDRTGFIRIGRDGSNNGTSFPQIVTPATTAASH